MKSAAIHCLRAGEGVTSHFPSERGELLQGIQEGDEAVQMAELNSDWDIVSDGDIVSGVAAAMAEAESLKLTYEEVYLWSD